MHVLIERRKTAIFGSPSRVEKLVAWSESRPQGSRLAAKRASGLTLEVVAAGSNPKVFIYFTPRELEKQLGGLRRGTYYLNIVEDGFAIQASNGKLSVSLIALPKKLATLWSAPLDKLTIGQDLLGMVEIAENCLRFHRKEECQLLAQAPAIQAVYQGKEKKVLSESAKNFLYRDAIASSLLMKSKQQ